ncbi:MAG: hypothetical protein ACN4GM_05550 [Gammaproteobacteria bacterium]
MSYQEISERLNHPGKPMFRFSANNKSYLVVLYRPSYQYVSYLFLFEDEILISVISSETGIKIWEEHFGKYSHALPKSESLQSIVKSFIDFRERIKDYSFYEFKRSRKSTSGKGALITEIGVVYWWVPGLPELLISTGIAMESIEEINNEIKRSKPYNTAIEIKPKKYYETLLKKYNNVKLGSNYNSIIKNLGNPTFYHSDKQQGALIYLSEEAIVLGLVEDKLQWISYDYPFIKKNEL